MPGLSLVVITKNEEASIARCLKSLPFATELIVVDSGSTDRTVEIARGLGAKVTQTSDWPGFGAQFNRAVDQATQDWIMSLDADEWIEPSLADEIARTIANPDAANGYEVPRRSRFCGVIVTHCGWSPDYTPRLVRRGHGRFTEELVHPHLAIVGTIGRLKHPIEHDSIDSLEDAEDKIIRYSDAAAAQMAKQGKRSSPLKASLRGWAAFAKTLIIRAGFLDGRTGLAVANYNRRYTDRKWRLLAERTRR